MNLGLLHNIYFVIGAGFPRCSKNGNWNGDLQYEVDLRDVAPQLPVPLAFFD